MTRLTTGGLGLPLAMAAAALVACKSKSEPTPNSKAAEVAPQNAPTDEHDASPPAIDAKPKIVLPTAPPIAAPPLGLPQTPTPVHNPTTPAKVALGLLLFFETRLSRSATRSCATCHQPEHGWASDRALDLSADNSLNLRHTPALANLAYHHEFYWDGRATPLEVQVLGHWQGQLGAPQEVLQALSQDPVYVAHFARAFESEVRPSRAAEAIAAYVRTLRVGNSSWDQYEAGDASAVSAEVIAGFKVFNERAGCATCHTPPLYTDLNYHSAGVGGSDPGRKTAETSAVALFKTPGLRGVANTAPYFHNGSAKSLDEVLTIKEGAGSPKLSATERAHLLLFLQALSGQPTSPARLAQPD